MFLQRLWTLILFTLLTSLLVAGSPIGAAHPDPPHQLIYQFPNETWVENSAVRANNDILVTLITSPEVWEINPSQGTAELVATFPNASSALGITEIEPDVFAVVLGAWSIETFQSTPGSYSVWQFDYTVSKDSPKTYKIADIPSAGFLNSITPLPTQKDTVLISDSYRGVIYSLNTKTGTQKVVIDASELKPKPGAVAKLGVNGIHYREGYLYFANSFNTPVLGRFELNPDGTAAGAAETIMPNPTYPTNAGYAADDFTFDKAGNI